MEEIASYARHRVEEAKKKIPLNTIREMAETIPDTNLPTLEDVLRDKTEKIHFICECKKASPSKGLIAPDFPYLDIAMEYESAGAGAISVLTEPRWFLGSDEYLKEIAAKVKIPCLRKDFTVDEYMIYEAKALGARAVLLICSILPSDVIKEYISICDALNISALVEAHDEAEVGSAVLAGARIIGVNNRNLKDFTVDINNSGRLRALVPPEVMFVAESGIGTHEDVTALIEDGVNGILIGETLMRSSDKKAKLRELLYGSVGTD